MHPPRRHRPILDGRPSAAARRAPARVPFRALCEDVFDAASSFLWSFPVGEQWADTDCIYNADPLIGGYWYWPAERTDDLVEAMNTRAAARGAVLRVHVAEPHEIDDEDDGGRRAISGSRSPSVGTRGGTEGDRWVD